MSFKLNLHFDLDFTGRVGVHYHNCVQCDRLLLPKPKYRHHLSEDLSVVHLTESVHSMSMCINVLFPFLKKHTLVFNLNSDSHMYINYNMIQLLCSLLCVLRINVSQRGQRRQRSELTSFEIDSHQSSSTSLTEPLCLRTL